MPRHRRGRGGLPLQISQGPLMQGGVQLSGRGMEREIPMDRGEGIAREGGVGEGPIGEGDTGEAAMDTGEGATGDLQDHMIGYLQTRIERLEEEVAAKDVQLFAPESELTVVLRERDTAVERLAEL